MTASKLILHWLSQSRSQRLVWLLEELEVDYEVKIYNRIDGVYSPPELVALHPLGRSPVLEIITNGKTRYLAESGHIFQYLLENFDPKRKLAPLNDDDKEELGFYLHFAEGTLQPDLVSLVIHYITTTKVPWGFRFLVSMVLGAINKGYYEPHLLASLDFLEGKIKTQHEAGSKYFLGEKVSGADMILYFPIYSNIFSDAERSKSIFATIPSVFDRFPHLFQWAQEIVKEPKLIRANKKIAELDPTTKI
ncbi:glutathione S-transferase [Scheffersomyces coipomensis]|uniref:glutathione S-transferase n=1 Tax=Scheffersomyces coipomensis TaxID=1788519 RepID=UPI00315D4D14